MKKNNFVLIFLYFLSIINVNSTEPDVFVQSTVNRASKILSDDISRIKKLKN